MTTDRPDRAPRLAESTRVEAFSDGVFAIALTLLVLDLRSPATGHGGFARALLSQWPAYVAYLAAFLNISAIWINHHELFTLVRRVDARLICANLLLLLVASLFRGQLPSSPRRYGTATTPIRSLPPCYTPPSDSWYPSPGSSCTGTCPAPAPSADPAATGYARQGIRRSLLSVIAYPAAAAIAFVVPLAALVAFAALPLFFIMTVVRPFRGNYDPAQTD